MYAARVAVTFIVGVCGDDFPTDQFYFFRHITSPSFSIASIRCW